MAAELVVGALVSGFLDPVVEKLTSVVVDLFRGKDEAILKLVEELKAKVSTADLLLIEAEEKLITDHKVRQWLDDLKDNIYNADDLVYMIETEAVRKELRNKVLRYIPAPYSTFNNSIKLELEETLGKLNLCLEAKEHGLERLKRMKLPERECAPLLEDDDVYGRDVNKEEILELLLQDKMASSSSGGSIGGGTFSVIPIVGMGGVGKTTLAQFVYKDERVNRRFGTRVWITVGDGTFDLSNVMRSIVEKVTSGKCEINELHDLQNEVKRTLSNKKFVFVLDDVWDEDRTKWNVLRSCFKSGLQGSKIIVTTRSTKVASVVKTGSIYKLKPLSNEDSWALFVNHALIDVDTNDCLDLEEVGQKIVAKCKGLPLAIKSIGDLLRGTRSKEEWESILNNDIWELYERKKVNILPALWLSYLYLPSKLKQCFAYCSLFPKDCEFDKENMILLWMAEGFLHSQKTKRVEEVGEEYFDDLVSKSFLQPSFHEWGEEPVFIMHDLIHDLATFVSGEFCLMMNGYKCSNKIRHFSFIEDCERNYKPKEFEEFLKAKHLRTIFWHQEKRVYHLRLLPLEHLHKSFPGLRVLSISNNKMAEFPNSIVKLKYLRYLKLVSIYIGEIPDAICKLYNLETLLLEGCSSVTRLPTDIGNLIKLRHLSVPEHSLEEMPLQLGKLQNLQTLNAFAVGRNRDSGGIKLLKEFQDLHGSLSIKGLENVSCLEEVSDASLKSKQFLSQLSMEWDEEYQPNEFHKERELLSALQPHPNLKELTIRGYKGNSFSNWMGDYRYLSNLVSLEIACCDNCSFLPSLGQLPSLKDLRISHCGVVRIDSKFYYSASVDSSSSSSVAIQTKPFFTSLETLAFENLSKLKEWSFIKGGVFPRLKNLHFDRCKRLKKVTLSGDYFPSLTDLSIHGSEKLIPLLLLPRDQLMQAPLISLKRIVFKFCENIMQLDEAAFQHLTSLEELTINYCPKLRCLPKELPTSLSDLHIISCPLLTPRVQRETGEDWSIIAHIPNIILDRNKI
ncbi:hypothetical protein CsatB_018720 [Cannabis sativa]